MFGKCPKFGLISVTPMEDRIILGPVDKVRETAIYDRGEADLSTDGIEQRRSDTVEFIDY